MAVDLPELHARALGVARRFVAGVQPDHWGLDSTCEGWDVRALVNHVVAGNLWVPELVAGHSIEEVGDVFDGDVLDDDPLGAYDASAGPAEDAFRGAGVMDAPVKVSYGPVPGSVYCGHRFIDVLIHGWDIAASTGQDSALPVDLVEACRQVVEPQEQLLVGSGMFGGGVDARPDGDPQARLLATLGRVA